MTEISSLEFFAPLFEPRSVAVIGASSTAPNQANNFLRNLRDYGFAGAIYPIHTTATEIDGLLAYPTLAATPGPIDYAFVAIAAPRVPDILQAANGRVRFAQVMSSGFAESEAGVALQHALVRAAHAGGMRLLGPNCLGTHSPRGRLTFLERAPPETGAVGVISQSGGLSVDILRRGQNRGLGFSGLVTVGNSADLGPSDLLEFFLADPLTRVIGLYIEDIADGRRFFNLLSRANAKKPVVLLKGGRTAAGQRAAASHTGSLAQDDRIWSAMARQTGTILVDTLDEFLAALLIFQTLQAHPKEATQRVVLFGNGGGTSVLASDAFARNGFAISTFDDPTLAALAELHLPAGSSIANPIDVPASILRQENGAVGERILDVIHSAGTVHALVMHLNLPVILAYRNVDLLGNLMKAALTVRSRHQGQTHFVLVLRSDGEPDIEARKRDYRHQAVALGIPVFDELAEAGKALAALATYERYRLNHAEDRAATFEHE
jgi:acyl-CoA synthetase (NDP forming)